MRGPSVRACIKRLKGITLDEIQKLSKRDLENLMKLSTIINPVHIMNEITRRSNHRTDAIRSVSHVISEHEQSR